MLHQSDMAKLYVFEATETVIKNLKKLLGILLKGKIRLIFSKVFIAFVVIRIFLIL